MAIDPHSNEGTLGEFYDAHEKLAVTDREACFRVPSSLKRLAAPYIYLESLILVDEVSLYHPFREG
jgi:hypothetical protein